MTLRNYLIFAVTVAMSCALVLAGCGGDEASSDSSTPAAAESAMSTEGASSTTTAAPAASAGGSAELGTRENPIPLGEEAQVGSWKVRVVGSTLDATQEVLGYNQFNEEPEPGKQYVLIEVEATRTGEDAAAFWVDMHYVFVGSGGNTFDAAPVSVPDSLSDTGEAYPGASIAGNLVFQVASDQVAGGALRLEEAFSFEETETFFAID